MKNRIAYFAGFEQMPLPPHPAQKGGNVGRGGMLPNSDEDAPGGGGQPR